MDFAGVEAEVDSVAVAEAAVDFVAVVEAEVDSAAVAEAVDSAGAVAEPIAVVAAGTGAADMVAGSGAGTAATAAGSEAGMAATAADMAATADMAGTAADIGAETASFSALATRPGIGGGTADTTLIGTIPTPILLIITATRIRTDIQHIHMTTISTGHTSLTPIRLRRQGQERGMRPIRLRAVHQREPQPTPMGNGITSASVPVPESA